jgi:hypothetical protein
VKLAATSPDGLSLGYFNRKNNIGRLHSAVGIRAEFDGDRVCFSNVDIATVDELAAGLPLKDRIRGVVKRGPQTLATIASELDGAKVESIDRVVRRHKDIFTKVSGKDGIQRIALVERRAS